MTLLHFDGFDFGDALTRYGVNFTTSSSTRFGTGLCLSQQNSITKIFTPSLSEVYVGVASSCATLDGAMRPYIVFSNDTSNQLVIGYNINTLFVRQNNVNGTVLTSAGRPFSAGSWYYLEAWWKPHASTGRIIVKVDGTTLVDFTGNTLPQGGTAVVASHQLGTNGTPSAWDDWYICDAVDATSTQGAPNNSFLGDVRVVTLAPTGAGASTGFTPSTGANWAAVDERPWSATDYVQGASGAKDTYVMSDLPATVASVIAVQGVSIGKKTDAGAIGLRNILRVGGTDYAGSTISLGTSDATLVDVWPKNPSTSALWTPSGVNGIEAGMEAV